MADVTEIEVQGEVRTIADGTARAAASTADGKAVAAQETADNAIPKDASEHTYMNLDSSITLGSENLFADVWAARKNGIVSIFIEIEADGPVSSAEALVAIQNIPAAFRPPADMEFKSPRAEAGGTDHTFGFVKIKTNGVFEVMGTMVEGDWSICNVSYPGA